MGEELQVPQFQKFLKFFRQGANGSSKKYRAENILTAPFTNMQTLKFKAQTTNAFFNYHQSNARLLLLASEYCRAGCNQIIAHSSVNKSVLGSS